MWSREELKTRAKTVLRGNYWQALGTSLVIAIATGGGGGGGGVNYRFSQDSAPFGTHPWVVPFALSLVSVAVLFVLAFRIFLGYPLEVGGRRFFVRAAQGASNMGEIGFGFKNKYRNILSVMLWRGVLLFFWFLLLIIPGIVKAYAYRMVPYILAENPGMDRRRAIALSEAMTAGHKWNIFVLDLSFLGWYLLGFLACCIGVVFVAPYVHATGAELYLNLRQNAIDSGICSPGELGMA